MLDPGEARLAARTGPRRTRLLRPPSDRHLPALAAAAPGPRRRGVGRGPVPGRTRARAGPGSARSCDAGRTWSTGRRSRQSFDGARGPDRRGRHGRSGRRRRVLRAVGRRPSRLRRQSPAGPRGPARTPRVLQLTCSPVHNSVPPSIRVGFRFGWSGVARALGRRLRRHGHCPPSARQLAQDGRALVRQPAHDPDDARPFGPAAAGAGAGGRTSGDRDGVRPHPVTRGRRPRG